MAGRRLSSEEQALWARVAGSVRALRPQKLALVDKHVTASDATPSPHKALHSHLAPRPGPESRAKPSANTLDGSWDKSIATGRITPDRTIDLHGHTLATAHQRLDRGLDEAIRSGARVVLLVTGRSPRAGTSRLDLPLRGIIRSSIGDWLAASPHRARIAAVRGAHPRHGGAGALYIVLRRIR